MTDAGGGGRKKILLVDDSATIRGFERMILGEVDFELIEARDGEEALFAAARDCPDLVLLDVNMPKIDGFETLRRLRKLEGMKTVPVIFITAVGANEGVAAAMEQDPYTDHLTKPLYAAALNQKIGKHLATRRFSTPPTPGR